MAEDAWRGVPFQTGPIIGDPTASMHETFGEQMRYWAIEVTRGGHHTWILLAAIALVHLSLTARYVGSHIALQAHVADRDPLWLPASLFSLIALYVWAFRFRPWWLAVLEFAACLLLLPAPTLGPRGFLGMHLRWRRLYDVLGASVAAVLWAAAAM